MTVQNLRKSSSRKGFNLIEAAIVLGVVGLVIGGIWVAASAVSDNYKVSETAKGLLVTCDKVSSLFNRATTIAGSGEDDITSVGVVADIFPKDWTTGALPRAPISGDILMTHHYADETFGGVNFGGAVSLYITDIPQKYCRRILPLLNTTSGANILWVTVGTGGYNTGWTTQTAYALPYTAGFISDGCGSDVLTKIELVCKQR